MPAVKRLGQVRIRRRTARNPFYAVDPYAAVIGRAIVSFAVVPLQGVGAAACYVIVERRPGLAGIMKMG